MDASFGIILHLLKISLGEGNLDVDPQFIDATGNFHLASSSPAIGKGPNGLDMGTFVPAGASISGEPDSITNKTQATLTIGGPGITHYTYSINDTADPWTKEFSLDDAPQILLNDLTDGQFYTVYVKGKNSADVWQSDPEYAISKTWKVDSAYTNIDIYSPDLPKIYLLHQNFPNPFNPVTTIKYNIKNPIYVTLKIYTLSGREIETLVNGFKAAGEYEISWDPKALSSGVYFYRLQAGDPSASSGQRFSETKKLIFQK